MNDLPDRREEEVGVILRAKEGDRSAVQALVSVYMPLIVHAAGRIGGAWGGGLRADLIQAGTVGLLQAIKRYEPSRQVRLGTYALSWIAGEMKREIGRYADHMKLHALRRQLEQAQERTHSQHQPPMGIGELSRLCGVKEWQALQAMTFSVCSAQGEVMEAARQAKSAPQEEKLELYLALDSLDRQARQVILLRYFRDYTQAQTAQLMGRSQAQISRIERRALDRLKEALSE